MMACHALLSTLAQLELEHNFWLSKLQRLAVWSVKPLKRSLYLFDSFLRMRENPNLLCWQR